MFQFKGHFDKLELDLGKASKTFKQALQVQVRQATREFVRAVIIEVPVYTGMARGSLKPIARIVNVAVPISPIAKGRNDKNIAKGESHGHVEFVDKGLEQGVLISITLAHYLTNEFLTGQPDQKQLIHPTPWKSFEAGKRAYKRYLRENLVKRMPRIASFLTKTRITIGG